MNDIPAFPLPNHTRKWDTDKKEYVQDEGMTLRDYFAAKAMQALIDNAGLFVVIPTQAYAIADLMMEARKK
jgi:hypothetical protein